MNGGQKTWLDSLTAEALEQFSEDMMAAVENGEDKEKQRFYEGMAVASKLAAMKLKGEFEYIDEEFIHHVYENMKMLNVAEIDDTFSTAQENTNERCSFCLQQKAQLARGPFASICEDCLQFGLQVIESQK
ncbi:hypothetical protein [Saccharococcus caldoxylosilyticus]|uniref:ATP-dependent Clp protease ATP-binding subunit ClpX zinc ribbon domain-containing protein n=2 Tax=Saccharococcus caldoxylosilyticus TaxID=81408 RepID=A0A023DFV8_9BACL|nr:hypothetical protein [Parageobacillus caldoxylosilyticus]MBB3851633.1 hypothetical protein [Parageobacillus caldoxylosilyticus]BDG35528.1 hypothetical protein PcaKH15_14340 [Parageobacillus caldoxylosilyticus]BDG39307.1 hypothetical protein PcaKH16_14460 [Parageobacillus caldoxylosilyticus]BDG43090.1 hypothetical protein PcaKH35_14350 [Parageobacillus caldoxylosilyticus]GAJ40113.1 hypothetical protein GCA01S_032_00300 [Parageobacillus caldoxylosilyticus NBRC 107762]